MKFFYEGRKHVVKRILAVGPVAEEMRDIVAAGLLRSAYQRWCHLHLIEGLIPDLIQSFAPFYFFITTV